LTKYQRYERTEKGRARKARYWDSPKGRETRRRDHLRKETVRREARINEIKELLT